MVGIMALKSPHRITNLLNSTKFCRKTPAKIKRLRPLKDILLQLDPSVLSDVLPILIELQNDSPGPIKKFIAEIAGEIGSRNKDFVPDVIPVLIAFLEDDTPAVVRQAIISGSTIFERTLERVAVQGLLSGGIDSILELSWSLILKFKDLVLPMAFQSENDGIRLLAVKFVERVILLYTPDPNRSTQLPSHQFSDGEEGFDISWLRGGHPLLNFGLLAMEASHNLKLLLDQLRFPGDKSLSDSTIIVLINSLSNIARRRPAYYGHVLPVLLGLNPTASVVAEPRFCDTFHVLKNAFLSFLKCSHSSALPWKDRVVGALEAMTGELVEHAGQDVTQASQGFFQSTDGEVKLLASDSNDAAQMDLRQKRFSDEVASSSVEDDSASKRICTNDLVDRKPTSPLTSQSSAVVTSLPREMDSGPVQQLVALFGALVAQGGRAADPLEILISSISSEWLAEVVMANMRFLPPACPKVDEDEVTKTSPLQVTEPQIISNVLSLFSQHESVSYGSLECQISQLSHESKEQLVVETVIAVKSESPYTSPAEENVPDESTFLCRTDSLEVLTEEIPGLNTSIHTTEIQDTLEGSHSSTIDTQGTYQDQISSSGAYASETSSPRASIMESSSAAAISDYILPKISAPIVHVTDEERDNIQKLAFMRIIQAYRQVAAAGGSHIRIALLCNLGAEYPLELDCWGLLQKHIMVDYVQHEGHELTLHVLYRLYKESEQNQDFLSSSAATSVYETFILSVAEMLRDSFPASDKSLTKLLGDAPFLPSSSFKLLENLCCPSTNQEEGKEHISGDRVTQGLSTIWSLIMLRGPIRDPCLKIALQSAVHHMEEVRMKAIRLVANKLYPMACISNKIEDFAKEMLLSVVNVPPAPSGSKIDESFQNFGVEKASSRDSSPAEANRLAALSKPSCTIVEAQRCMSLYFALCTKKHSLLRLIFVMYENMDEAVKQAVHRHMPILIRTVGSSAELLRIILDPPSGSISLVIQVLRTLTDGIVPSLDLVSNVRKLYDSKIKDIEILLPVLPYMSKDEVLTVFPQLVNLPLDKFQAVLARIFQGSTYGGASLTPTEVLIAIHGIDPEKDGIPLKKVMDACSACFEQRQVFTQQVFAKALNQLVEQIPLPLLFMRTVIQTVVFFPDLFDFIMEILSRLVSKQIWKYPKLWVGFLKCVVQTKPQSFSVLLQLPAVQLENALNKNPILKPSLVTYASQPHIRSSLPRSTMVVLGLVQDSQNQQQTQNDVTQREVAEVIAPQVAKETTLERSGGT